MLITVLVGSAFTPAPPPPPPGAEAALRTLRAQAGPAIQVGYHRGTGLVNFLAADPARPFARPAAAAAAAPPDAVARAFLAEYGALFGVRDAAGDLRLMREKPAEAGRTVLRYQQLFQGVPVLAGELIVHLDVKGNVLSVNGETLAINGLNTSPAIDAATAEANALDSVAKKYNLPAESLVAAPAALWIYDPVLFGPNDGRTQLVWRTEVTPRNLSPVRELVLVEAARGGVVLSFNQVDTALSRVIYDNNNDYTKGLPGDTIVRSEGGPASGIADADNAYLYAGDVYAYYVAAHSRDSLDGAGMQLVSTVRYCPDSLDCPYENAFWSGDQMVYGDGYSSADDVVGHEMTHGVTQYESNLFYYYQSGAINESLSDLWGELIDLQNGHGNDAPGVRWLMGEDMAGGAIRSMSNPPAYGDPDKITSGFYYIGANDSGGVHTNSGVNNKAVFLLVDGATFNGRVVTAIGAAKTAAIYYKVQTDLLTSGADYSDLANTLQQACSLLIGTGGISMADCTEVGDAIDAVEMRAQPVSGFNEDAPFCDPDLSLAPLFSDNLESGSSNWSFGALSGTTRWQYDAPWYAYPYATSGVHHLYADDYPDDVADTYAAMTVDVPLPSNAYLRFAHAYGFEGATYDGGVLEYSTNSGGLWNDAGPLIDFNGYDGTISSGYSNPLGGRQGFVADSHGYISSRVDLSSLAGQSVRFRWRMGLDTSGYDWGWWLDDVNFFSCASPYQVYLPLVLRNYGGTGLGTPTLLTPADGTVLAKYTFDWTDVAGATGYHFQLSTSTSFSPLVVDAAVGSSQYDYTSALSGTHYWRVYATGPSGSGPNSAYHSLVLASYNADDDGDSLRNGWELHGYDYGSNGTIDVNLPAMGANYRHKDLFVEMDYMERPGYPGALAPSVTVQNAIVSAFAAFPMTNPDGATGVNIHLDLNDQVPYDSMLDPYLAEFNLLKATWFPASRLATHHYMIWANQYGGSTSSGVSMGIPASDFMVTLGGWSTVGGTNEQKIGTFIHELGHNLNLTHGGSDHVNYKPNYISIMNYTWQTLGVRHNSSWYNWEYQPFALPALNEASLNEPAGLGSAAPAGYGTVQVCSGTQYLVADATGPIDWNCDGDAFDTGVSHDENLTGTAETLAATSNNYDQILFNGGTIGSGLAPAALREFARRLAETAIPVTDELTWEMQQKIDEVLRRTPVAPAWPILDNR
jgi:Zn-dependent metalloprotease